MPTTVTPGRRGGRPLAGVVTVLLACQAAEAPGEEGTGTTGGPQRPAPTFIQPASDELHLGAHAHDDVFLTVRDVFPGLTSLRVDEIDVGTLQDPAHPVGNLTADTLRLNLHGGLVTGTHTLQLVTPDPQGLLTSETVTVFVEEDLDPPTWSVTLETSPLPAAELRLDGTGARALLTLRAPGPTTALTLVPLAGATWDAGAAAQIDLPSPPSAPLARAAATSDLGVTPGARRRLAFREGPAGPTESVWIADVTPDGPTPAARALVAGDLAAGAEWVELGALAWADDLLLVELVAPRDTEDPAPRDRSIVAIPTAPPASAGEPPRPAQPRLLSPLGATDVDAMGPALDLAALRAEVPAWLLSVRADGRVARVLSAEPSTAWLAPVPSVVDPADFAAASPPLSSLLGAFGARQVFAAHDDLAHLEAVTDAGVGGTRHSELGLDAAPTGVPAVGFLAGAPVWLVPMGADQPVLAATSDGTRLRPVLPTGNPLACDEVALGPDYVGNLDGRLALACRQGQTLLLGSLAAAPG